ncbi:MAG: adenylate/guanylate cyclase domain-containing protein, partial [Pseudomonadota bacterium]
VMAAFTTPAQAAAAALAIQQEIAEFNADSGDRALTVKLGIHDGPSIVVTLNGRLDYFGSTVNKAARLQGCSKGGDIVISQSSAGDPEVERLLVGSRATIESARLKGFDGPVHFTRIAPHEPLVSANEA